jgi:hypothetical protein
VSGFARTDTSAYAARDAALRVWEGTGAAGLYLFAFGAVLSTVVSNIGLFLMTVAALAQYRQIAPAIRRCPPCWLMIGGAIMTVISAALAAHYLPETAAQQWEQAKDWTWLALVMVVAWWLRRSPVRFYVAAGLFAAGATVRVLMHTPWHDLGGFLGGGYPPYGFGLWHISFSSYFVVILLTLALLGPSAWVYAGRFGPRGRTVIVLAAAALTLISLEVIFVGKSRGTWAAMALVVLPLLGWYAFRRLPGNRRALVALAAIAVLLLSFGATKFDTIAERMSAESEVIEVIVEGGMEDVPLTNIGVRAHLYRIGLDRWLERPFLGWGPGSGPHLMQADSMFPRAVGNYTPPHFHNIALELLVRFGLIGVVWIAAIVAPVYARVYRLHRDGRLPENWYLLLMGVLLFGLVWGMADIRIVKWDYRNFFMLYFGLALALQRAFVHPDFFVQLQSVDQGLSGETGHKRGQDR